MLKHIVMWKFKEEAEGRSKAENLQLVREQLLALQGVVEPLRSIEIGLDVSRTDMSYDMVLVTTFEDAAALHAYQVHPEHVKISQYVSKVRTSRAVVDYCLPDMEPGNRPL